MTVYWVPPNRGARESRSGGGGADNKKNARTPIKKVTQIATLVDLLKAGNWTEDGCVSEVIKLLRLYLTVPMTNATAERSFSTLRRLKKKKHRKTVMEKVFKCFK